MTLSASKDPSGRRDQRQMEALRSSTETTTPTNPQVLLGSWAGRSSSTIWCSSPRSMAWRWLRRRRSHTCNWWPYSRPRSFSGTTPFSNMSGVPHSLEMSVSKPRCHQKS